MGTALLKKMSAVSVAQNPISNVSFENEIYEADIAVDTEVEGLTTIAEEISGNVNNISTGFRVADSLTAVVDNTIALADGGQVTEKEAELLRVSVESILRVAGMDIPVGMVCPSFESSALYSAEVIDKRDNVLTRIMSWLYSAIKAVGDGLKQWWLKLTTSNKAVLEYTNRVNEKVKKLSGEPSDPEATINLGGSAIWLTDRNERIAKPDRQIVETVARFEDFVIEWRKMWGGIIDFPIPETMTETSAEETSKKLRTLAADTVSGTKEVKVDITVGHHIELKPGSGDVPMLSATVKIIPNVSGNNHIGKVLTLSEMKDGISTAISSFEVLKKLEKEMDTIEKATKRVANLAKKVSVKGDEKINETELRQSLKALSKACGFASWGWTNAVPYYLKTIKSCVRYIDASANRYSK